MSTLSELDAKMLRLLDDPSGASYSEEIRLDAIVAAHNAILPWRPKPQNTNLIGDGDEVEFSYPADLFEAQAVIVQETGEILPYAVFQPGSYHGEGISPTNDWIEYPDGSITFSKPLTSGEIYELWYSAYWDVPDDLDDTDPLEVPSVAITGLSFYGAAYLLMPGAIGAAEIRQFNIDVDSGNPEHNPVQEAVTYLMNMFQQEMNRLPAFQRMQK